MKTLSIVHVISSLDVGGAETTLYRLLSRTDRDAFRSSVVSLLPGGPVKDLIAGLGIPVASLGMRRGRPSMVGLVRLVRHLRRAEPDIVQTWLYHADLLGLIAARLAGRPATAWNLRCSDTDPIRRHSLVWTRWTCARLAGQPAVVVANSNAARRFHQRAGYSPRRWEIIPNGVDTEAWKPDEEARLSVRRELGVATDVALIGLVARFDPMKDHRTFLEAADSVATRRTDVHFVMVGEGVTHENPSLRHQLNTSGLGRRVHLLGRRSDVPRLTAALDIAALSSYYGEGFPNVVIEAMACGVPCVATDVGDSAHMIGKTGVIVPRQRPDLLADAWLQLLALGRQDRQRLGQAARERVERDYSLTTMVRRYEALYRSICDNGQPCVA